MTLGSSSELYSESALDDPRELAVVVSATSSKWREPDTERSRGYIGWNETEPIVSYSEGDVNKWLEGQIVERTVMSMIGQIGVCSLTVRRSVE